MVGMKEVTVLLLSPVCITTAASEDNSTLPDFPSDANVRKPKVMGPPTTTAGPLHTE